MSNALSMKYRTEWALFSADQKRVGIHSLALALPFAAGLLDRQEKVCCRFPAASFKTTHLN